MRRYFADRYPLTHMAGARTFASKVTIKLIKSLAPDGWSWIASGTRASSTRIGN